MGGVVSNVAVLHFDSESPAVPADAFLQSLQKSGSVLSTLLR